MKMLFALCLALVVIVISINCKSDEPTQTKVVTEAFKNAPRLVKEWRENKSAEAEHLLREYLVYWKIPVHKLGLTPKEAAQLRQTFPRHGVQPQ